MRKEPGRGIAQVFAWASILGLCYVPVVLAVFASTVPGHDPVSPAPTLARTAALTRNTVVVAGGAAVLAVFLGIPYGLLVARSDLRLRRVLQALSLLPLLMPACVSGTGWIYALGAQGFLNTSASAVVSPDLVSVKSLGVVASAGVLGLAWFPLVALATGAAARSTDKDLEDTASLVSERWGVLKTAVLPYVLPSSLAAGCVAFMLSAADFGVPALFGVNVLTVEVYEQFAAYYNPGAAVAAMIPLLVISALALAGSVALFERRSAEVSSLYVENPRLLRLGRFQTVGLAFCAGVLFLALVVPAVALLRESGSLLAFETAWRQGAEQVRNTCVYATWAASICVLVGLVTAYFVSRGGLLDRYALRLVSYLAVAIPGGITGIGLIGLWNRPGPAGAVYSSAAILVMGFVSRFLPVAVLITGAGIGQAASDLEEPARLAGAGWIGTVRAAVLPLIRGWLGVGWLAVFALSVGELSAAVLVSPPGCETLPVRIFSLMHFGASPVMAALSLMQMALALIPLALAGVVMLVQRAHAKEGRREA